MSIVSSPLDFSQKGKAAVHPSIRELSIVPASGSTTVTLAASGTVSTKFYFGSQPHYKGKYTKLRGVLSVPAQPANFTVLHSQPALCVQNITLTSSSGAPIVQVQDVNAFLRMSSQALTSMDEFETNEKNGTDPLIDASYVRGAGPFFASNNKLVSVGPNAVAGIAARGPVARGVGNTPLPNTPSDLSYVEQNYQIATSAINTGAFFPFEFDFSLFKETYLSNDKIAYAPQDMILNIDWAPIATLGYQTTNLTLNTAAAAITGPVVISNLEMILGVESNVELAQAKMQQHRTSGSSELIPYLTAVTNAHAAGASSSYSLPLNRAWGKSLLAIYTEVHNAITTLELATDISNVENAKVITQQTSFDNQNLTENVLTCARNEDYKYMKRILEGSVAANSNIWKFNRCYIDSWRAGKCVDWNKSNTDGIEDGVSLEDRSKSWQIRLTTDPALPLLERYWVVTQRMMTVDPSGQTMVV
jgi:hypothetical protein